ncbi:hypothetical protein QTH87_00435 [Variovorax sp. J22P168]|uniref:hypothetical protein n=1 Tax=Variovorax jilinensis TaxID=3053513 RepID=UPI0025776791|nr:hypothetical protein [Variovorax sp. J22P168]MDM0010891.1 hypothetical protein [Variovorax sp. J22P168]
MKIRVDSVEYRCWHELGHATVCLHLGGGVDFIELLDGDVRGYARARCVVLPEIERRVACGGFAAEFYLLSKDYAERGHGDNRDISQIVFHNATHDRQDFWGREPGSSYEFSAEEDTEFMHHAIGPDGLRGVIPIFNRYFPQMQQLVRELGEAGRVEGKRVREVLRVGASR